MNELEKSINNELNLWNYKAVIFNYEQSLKINNTLLLDYIIFLADTGNLDILYNIFELYQFDYIQSLINDLKYISSKKNNVRLMINFYKNEYIPALYNTIEKKTIETDLIYLSNQKTLMPLLNYLEQNSSIFKNSDAKSQMILSFAINKLIEHNLLTVKLSAQIIDTYYNFSINHQRKKYILSKLVNYFYEKNKKSFFYYSSSNRTHIFQLASLFHRYGDINDGSKIYLSKLQMGIKQVSLTKKLITKKPRVAVCISGMLRGNTEYVFSLLKKNIIAPLDADVFIHTWDEKHEWMGFGGNDRWVHRFFGFEQEKKCPVELRDLSFLREHFPRTANRLGQIISRKVDYRYLDSLYPYKEALIENEEDFLKGLNIPLENLETRGHYNQIKMFYGIYKSIDIMRDYEKNNNIKYDYIIRSRPDIGLFEELSFEALNKLEINEILTDFFSYGPQDQFFAGNAENMIYMSNIWKEILDKKSITIYKEFPKIYAHVLMYIWMIDNNLIPTPLKIKRDLSTGIRGAKVPDFSKELEIDFKNLSDEYKKREDFKDFFNSLLERI